MPQTTRELLSTNGIRFGLTIGDRERQAARLNAGLREPPEGYGPCNHLREDFDVIAETLQELDDAFAMIAAIGSRRAREACHGRLPTRELPFGDSDTWIALCQHIAFAIRLAHKLRKEQDAPPDEDL